MKSLLIILLFCSALFTANAQKKIFLRIYDMNGKKMAKGLFAGATDSSLVLINNKAKLQIPVSQIGNIKTKRTAGHSMLVTGAVFTIGTALVLNFGVTINDGPGNLMGQAALASFSVGTLAGVFIGGIGASLKHSEKFEINGNADKWLVAKPVFDKMPVYKGFNKK